MKLSDLLLKPGTDVTAYALWYQDFMYPLLYERANLIVGQLFPMYMTTKRRSNIGNFDDHATEKEAQLVFDLCLSRAVFKKKTFWW